MVAGVVLWLPIGLSLMAVVALLRLLDAAALYAGVWLWWIGRAQRRVLFVYSDSPSWKEHIESEILPRLPSTAVVLNWSERSRWPRLSLPVRLFGRFSGQSEFNPIGLVFERFAWVRRYRFWQPLRDMKHGRP
jgi:hypothetical protein